MQPDERDLACLWDMWRAARDISDFTADLTFLAFSEDRRSRFAVERQLMVVGEAAGHVSLDLKEAYPEIPWPSIIGLRNVLAHEYGEVLVERIWIVAVEHLPELMKHLEALVLDLPAGDTPM